MRTLAIYRNTAEGPVRVAELRSSGGSGPAGLTVLSEPHREAIGVLLGTGVGSRALRRPVKPEEGDVYLDALKETLRTSTYWSAVDEPSAPHRDIGFG